MSLLRANLWPGALALGASLGLAVVALAALLHAAPSGSGMSTGIDSYVWRVLRFTLLQASLSTLLSVGLAIPVARAMARRPRFPGRQVLLGLFGLPLVMPVIVAVFGLAAIYGQNGIVNDAIAWTGLARQQILYGLGGILIAHVFFNLPLSVRLLLLAWQAIPGESWRLASQFGMSGWQIFRLIEWPRLREVVPGVAVLVFLLCFTSFAVVLTLGGGPQNATLEVAIYQSLRLDFDIPRAVVLAVLQVVLCAFLATALLTLARTAEGGATLARDVARPDRHHLVARIVDTTMLALAALFVVAPLIAVVVAGLMGPLIDVLQLPSLWQATARSLFVGVGGGLLALLLGTALLVTTRDLKYRRWRPRLAARLELLGSLNLVVSPTVLGAGLFVLLLPFADVLGLALWLVIIVNGIIFVPYVLRTVGPRFYRVSEDHDRLCASLGIKGINRLRLVEWPAIRRPAALGLAIAGALSLGDLTAIALFGSRDTETLSLMLYRSMAAYRMDQAAVIALVLAVVCLTVFLLIERVVGGRTSS
ncbi:MAG: thiamine/thiamine pyrophosphate ABC transporter permease [Pseudomonadota bacterium]